MSDFLFKNKFMFLIFFGLVVVFSLIFKGHKLYVISNNHTYVKDGKNYYCKLNQYGDTFDNYYIYADNNYFGKRNLKFDEYLHVSDNRSVYFNSNFVAFNNKKKISFISSLLPFNDGSMDVMMIEYLNRKNIYNIGQLYSNRSLEYNFKNGGSSVIGECSNIVTTDDVPSYFSAIYIYNDGEFLDVFYDEASSVEDVQYCHVENVININNDDSIELIIGCSYYVGDDRYRQFMYQYKDGQGNVIDCK